MPKQIENFKETFARSIFSAMAAFTPQGGTQKNSLKMLIYSCKLRFFDDFCLDLTKNHHRAKVSLPKYGQ